MPDKVVQVPGVGTVSFPDSMSDDDIGKALQSHSMVDHTQPEGFWRTVYDRSGLGAIQKLSGSLADWAAEHAKTKEEENLRNVAQGGKGNAIEAYSPHAGYDLLSHGARMISSAFDPKSAAITAGVALANTNPVTGIPVDAALVAHGGYGVAKNAKAALGGNPDAAENALMSGAEMAGGAAGVGGKARSLSSGQTAQRLYQSALKPSTTLSQAQRTTVIKTGLENRIPVSEGGVAKIGALLEELQGNVQDIIDARPNAKIDPNRVAQRINDVKGRFANQVNATEDLNAIESSRQQFLTEQGAKPGKPAIAPSPTGLVDPYGNPIMGGGKAATPPTKAPPMSASQAQDLKTGTYQQLKSRAYGELKSATVESQKALARGIKEELENQFPEIKSLNAKQSQLIGLDKALERAVGRIENHQIIGIGTPLAAAGAKAVTGSSGLAAVTGILKAVFDDPFVKSKLAITLNHANKGAVPLSASQVRIARYGALLAGSASAQPPAGQSDE